MKYTQDNRLTGYEAGIMVIIERTGITDKSELQRLTGFGRVHFAKAWEHLKELGYIMTKRGQHAVVKLKIDSNLRTRSTLIIHKDIITKATEVKKNGYNRNRRQRPLPQDSKSATREKGRETAPRSESRFTVTEGDIDMVWKELLRANQKTIGINTSGWKLFDDNRARIIDDISWYGVQVVRRAVRAVAYRKMASARKSGERCTPMFYNYVSNSNIWDEILDDKVTVSGHPTPPGSVLTKCDIISSPTGDEPQTGIENEAENLR